MSIMATPKEIFGIPIILWPAEKYNLPPDKAEEFEGLFWFLIGNMTPEAARGFADLFDRASLSGGDVERFAGAMAAVCRGEFQ